MKTKYYKVVGRRSRKTLFYKVSFEPEEGRREI